MKKIRIFVIVGLAICAQLVVSTFIGCPFGTPFDHSRPHGHQNTSIMVSPNGESILFNASGTGGRDLYELQLADLSVTKVAETTDYETFPSYSPNGTKIVYSAGIKGDRADHIFTIARNGTEKTQLTNSEGNDTSPRFSPDGSQIVFVRDKTYNWGGLAANWDLAGVIFVINSDGTNERQLTPDDLNAMNPWFTEDGESVIYATDSGLFTLPVDGSVGPKKIGPSYGYNASFSSDRQRILYSHGTYSPDHEVYLTNLETNDLKQLSSSENGCFHPVFSASEEEVYFLMEEWPDGYTGHPKSSIWIVKIDGTGQRQLTDLSLFDSPGTWKPKETPSLIE